MRECQVCKQCYPDAVTTCPQDNQLTFQSIEGNPILEGKYRLEKRLGAGGMGVVYCARHTYLKTQLAIKVILPDLVGNDPQLVTRFRQEALAAAAIRHQNVVQVTDYGVVNEKMPFLVMEYVEGESLHDLLAREKRLSPDRAVELMSAICAGVGAAHRQGIVHRDLKPLNIMILKGAPSLAESVKILDFGLAKIKSGELLGSFVQAQTTGLMGSPYYMAPEQWADEEPDAQADVYSLGVMLFQMLAGDVPFKGSSIPAIMQKHLNNPPPSFAEMGVQVPPMIEEAVRHSLAKDRHQRTQSVQDLVAELRRGLGLNTQPLSTSGLTGALPVSSVHILTNPPQANVFMDNVAVGESQSDGYLLLEGIQSGNHRIRISKDGFYDWENQIFCDGKPQQVVAQLQNSATGVDPAKTVLVGQQSQNFVPTQGVNTGFQQTAQGGQSLYSQTGQTSQPGVPPNSQVNWQQSGQQSYSVIEEKRPGFSPVVLGITGIFGLLLLLGIGFGGAYMAGIIGKTDPTATPTQTSSPTTVSPTPPVSDKNEMVMVMGGSFKMGNNKGTDLEKPEHDVDVKSFWMDKTEVTNAEYYQFVTETKYGFIPAHWVNDKPAPGTEKMPVRNVNQEDVKAFIEWRSKRDNLKYRLPSEEEWEFAARNGAKATLYPWGNDYKEHCAVVGKSSADVEPVGSRACGASEAGLVDLVGNVWEWTSNEAKAYPGAPGELKNQSGEQIFMIRGGSVFRDSKGKLSETSTYRVSVPGKSRDNRLGFRLVRDAG
jgi:serine/threonine-protein kinase